MLALSRTPQDGLIVLANNLFTVNRTAIVEMAARQRWPAVYNVRAFVTNGGLLSYGVDVTDLYERAATYVDRILRGAKAGDLPIQQPTKYELIINLKTAKALGLILPPTLLAIADEVIE
jgi:putative ABC transport system substrate-binding protein